ncbi:MAG: Asp23/Gls24 family envelope stress response protein [Candidatus Sumerlaeaceae bacterium]|nr:Asp23/Gls24 family envelope stress response protein [Candidatus Sumerlaeaceae bacterium]
MSESDGLHEQGELGNINVNEDVVAHHASLAILEVEGVASISGKGSFSDYVGVKSKDVDKGVSVKIDEKTNLCSVNVEVNIEYGTNVYDAARKLQRAVKNSIENLVGLQVSSVNVAIRGLVISEVPRSAAKNRAA